MKKKTITALILALAVVTAAAPAVVTADTPGVGGFETLETLDDGSEDPGDSGDQDDKNDGDDGDDGDNGDNGDDNDNDNGETKEPDKPAPAPMKFKDVNSESWYYDDVKAIYESGLVQGLTPTVFSPNKQMSRGEFVMILYRYYQSLTKEQGLTEYDTSYVAKYRDVPDGKWYTEPVMWASQSGLVNGYANGKFGPNDSITRQDLMKILAGFWEMIGWGDMPEGDISGHPDVSKIYDYALPSVKKLMAKGIVRGKNDGKIAPTGRATRAEVSAMLNRFTGHPDTQLSSALIKGISSQYRTGLDDPEIVPVLSYGSLTLEDGTDYTSVFNYGEDGSGSVTFSAVEGSGYTGTVTKDFRVIHVDASTDIADGTEACITAVLDGTKARVLCERNGNVCTDLAATSKLEAPAGSRWRFTLNSDLSYTVTNTASGRVLDVAAGSSKDGANVGTYAANGTPAQAWFLIDSGDGTYGLMNAGSGRVLDIAAGSTRTGANVCQYTANGSAAQCYSFCDHEFTYDIEERPADRSGFQFCEYTTEKEVLVKEGYFPYSCVEYEICNACGANLTKEYRDKGLNIYDHKYDCPYNNSAWHTEYEETVGEYVPPVYETQLVTSYMTMYMYKGETYRMVTGATCSCCGMHIENEGWQG